MQEYLPSNSETRQIAGHSQAALYRERADRMERDAPVINALNETLERHNR